MSKPGKFSVVRLATLAHPAKGSMAGGPFGSDLVSRDYVPAGVPVVRGTNLPKNSKLSLKDCVFVSERKADSLHLNCAHPGDLVFTQRGTLGQVGLVPSDTPYSRFLISQSQMKMTVDRSKADPIYVYYYFRLPSTVTYIENHALQAGVPHINLGILRRFEIICPSRVVQHKIAAILSAYDDLIANNQRRVALLERMAVEIYREWFVRLRFPGHAQATVGGGIPQGWSIRPSNEAFDVLGGGTPNTETPAYWNGDIRFFTPKDATDNFFALTTEKSISEKGLEACSSQLFPRNTVFITARGTVGKLALAGRPMAMNQSCYALKPRHADAVYFHYLAIRESITYLKGVSKSGVFDNIIMDTFKTVPLLIPPSPMLEAFNQLVQPIFSQAINLQEQNKCLGEARDALLPRLISGKLAVDGLRVKYPPAMAAKFG